MRIVDAGDERNEADGSEWGDVAEGDEPSHASRCCALGMGAAVEVLRRHRET